MYKWYSNAEVCYAFLEDLETVQTSDSFLSDLGKCRWFTRGWTLQELIAPRQITFFNKNWVEVGDKESLSGVITEITRVDGLVLRKGVTIQQLSIANRMSWLHVGKQLAPRTKHTASLGYLASTCPCSMARGTKRLFFGCRKKFFGKQKISLYLRGHQKSCVVEVSLNIGVCWRQPRASSRPPLSMFRSDIQNAVAISRLPIGASRSGLQ